MLGCVAAVMETESPSQLSPAVIQRMCTSFTAGGCCVDLPYGIASTAMAPPFGYPASVWARTVCSVNEGGCRTIPLSRERNVPG